MSVVINDAALTAFLVDPAGGISRHLKDTVVPTVLALAQDFISRPWPGGGRGARFPPPGPPYQRSGDLRNSLTVETVTTPMGDEYDIVPLAVHRGANYGLILKARGYRFLPDIYYV